MISWAKILASNGLTIHFNPWIGCTKVSEGCAHCYAEQSMDHRLHVVQWGPTGTRERTSEANWKLPLRWNNKAKREGRRRRVFCASLADIFEYWRGGTELDGSMTCHKTNDELVINDNGHVWPAGWPSLGDGDDWGMRPYTMDHARARLFRLIERTRNLDWLLLTKRPENVCEFIGKATGRSSREWLADCKHVWIGTSIENQETADKRIPHLLTIPAAVRFLSIEPLLGPIDLPWLLLPKQIVKPFSVPVEYMPVQSIDWIIVGGESGQHARPMHQEWARSLRDQCVSAGVPFFFKQWGEWIPYEHDAQPPFWESQNGDMVDGHALPSMLTDRINETVNGWMLDDQHNLYRLVGKKSAGRLLDGREWSEMPSHAPANV